MITDRHSVQNRHAEGGDWCSRAAPYSPSMVIFILFAICLSLFCSVWASRAGPATGIALQDILLITLDTVRVDHLGAYGYAPAYTPIVDYLSRRGIIFQRMFSDVPQTLPAHSTILSGLNVLKHGVRSNIHGRFPKDKVLISEVLKKRGYQNAAIIGGIPLAAHSGLNRGFNLYDDRMTSKGESTSINTEKKADEVTTAALAWLRKKMTNRVTRRPSPLFLWVHYYDAHAPYTPPRQFNPGRNGKYDGEISAIDRAIDKLLGHWPKGNSSSLKIVLCADHGEALGDHGEQTHGIFLYRETMHVPCIIVPQWSEGAGQAVIEQSLHSLEEIGDFILSPPSTNNMQISRDSGAMTAALFPDDGRAHYSETTLPLERFHWSPLQALRKGKWLYVSSAAPELYDTSVDPQERHNCIDRNAEQAREFARQLKHIRIQAAPSASLDSNNSKDRQTIEALNALGYIAGFESSSTEDPFSQIQNLTPPVEKIRCLPFIEKGNHLLDQNKIPAAIRELKKARKCDTHNPDVLNNLGIACQRIGKLDESQTYFELAIKASPRNARFWNNVGVLYRRRKLLAKAMNAYEKAIECDGMFTPAKLNLAIVCYEIGQRDRACRILKQVLADKSLRAQARQLQQRIGCVVHH